MITGHRKLDVDAYISHHNGWWTAHLSIWEGQKHLVQTKIDKLPSQQDAEMERDEMIYWLLNVNADMDSGHLVYLYGDVLKERND